jgi:hypothetical protein
MGLTSIARTRQICYILAVGRWENRCESASDLEFSQLECSHYGFEQLSDAELDALERISRNRSFGRMHSDGSRGLQSAWTLTQKLPLPHCSIDSGKVASLPASRTGNRGENQTTQAGVRDLRRWQSGRSAPRGQLFGGQAAETRPHSRFRRRPRRDGDV